MEDVANVLEKSIQQREVGNASFDELNIILRRDVLNIGSLPRREVIKSYHPVTTFQQLLSQVRTDESCPTGYDCCVLIQDSPGSRYMTIFAGSCPYLPRKRKNARCISPRLSENIGIDRIAFYKIGNEVA